MTKRKRADQARENRRAIRETVRLALTHWRVGRFGAGEIIAQNEIVPKLTKNLANVVKAYPLAISKDGRTNHWDMPKLAQIMLWDDPVLMLQELARFNPAWFPIIAQAELDGCSEAQEDTIRQARWDLINMAPTPAVPEEDPMVISWDLYSLNNAQRLHFWDL